MPAEQSLSNVRRRRVRSPMPPASSICTSIRLFAARRRAARSRGSPSSPRPTASRRWRSPTPTTCSARWNSPTRWRATASSRSSAARWRSISATRIRDRAPGAGAAAHCRGSCCSPPSEARLPQPDAADLARLPRTAGERAAARQARLARGRCRRPDRADRRPGGPLDRAIAAGQADLAAARCERARAAVRRPALCRAAAPRPRRPSAAPSRR